MRWLDRLFLYWRLRRMGGSRRVAFRDARRAVGLRLDVRMPAVFKTEDFEVAKQVLNISEGQFEQWCRESGISR